MASLVLRAALAVLLPLIPSAVSADMHCPPGSLTGFFTGDLSGGTCGIDEPVCGLSGSGQPLPGNPSHCAGSFCGGIRNCRTPTLLEDRIDIVPQGAGLFQARLLLDIRVPYNLYAANNGSVNGTTDVLWFNTSPVPSFCGGPPFLLSTAEYLNSDRFVTFLSQEDLTCDGAPYDFGVYSAQIKNCQQPCLCALPFPPNCICGGLTPATGATWRDINGLEFKVSKAMLGCKEPPKRVCPGDGCNACLIGSGGGGSGSGGGPPGWGPPPSADSGPGARLFHRGGGAGGDEFPGTATWLTELGLYWSHDYAERIIQDPDDSHVWLITKQAIFREFSDLNGGIYQTVSPTDEYRTLRRTAGGWTLTGLNGTVQTFNSAGRWESTADRFGNAKTAGYNLSGQLETVSFPDGRSETFTYYPSGKLASITEVGVLAAESRTWSYTWGAGLDEHLLERIDLPDGLAYEFTYGDVAFPGYLTLVELVGTSAGRRVVTGFEYDALGNTTAMWRGDSTPAGPNAVDVWQLSFDNPILPVVTTVTDPLGQNSVYTLGRDSNSLKPRLERLTGSCPTCGTGPNSELFYNDPAHPLRPTRQTDAGGDHTDFTYAANGQVLTRTEAASTPLERTTTWTYDVTYPTLVTSIEQPSVAGGASLRTTSFTYNGSGALTQRRIEGVEDPGGAFLYDTVYTPSAEGQNLIVDPPGYGTDDQTSFTYDPARGDLLVSTRTDPIVGTTGFAYDPYNRRESVTDPNGVTTTTTYDALNRVTTITQEGATPAEDLVTTHEYTEHGDLLRTTLPEGNVIEYGYDTIGRLVAIERNPNAATPGERTLYTLDTIGNRIREDLQRWTGSAWETRSFTQYEYSTRCQLDAVVHADGTKTEYAYDCEGNLQNIWDANHPSLGQTEVPTTGYAYDALDRLTQVSQRWGGSGGGFATTSYGYDVQDHLTSVTDAELNVTVYAYSDRDLLTQETSPVSGVTSHLYNEHGELTETTDARSVTMIRTLDALDRVTLMDYPGTDLDVAYTYDDSMLPFSLGRLTAITRDGASIDYDYDRFGRLTQDGALAYTYDKNGNRSEIVYPGGVTAAYGFDFADRPASLTVKRAGHPDQVVASGALYEPSGPLGDLQLGNGLTENRAWSNRYFPQDIQVNGVSTLFQWLYSTDFVGNPTLIADGLNAANNRTYDYQDFQYFLTQGDGPWGQQGWTYDKIGNRLTETKGALTDTYSYVQNGATRNTALLDEITLGATGTRDYQYGPAGHLERVTAPGNEILFTTDAAGRQARLDRAAGDAAADFTYDGRNFLSTSQAGTVTEVFTDGFESGDARCWDGEFGATLNAGTADCDPKPKTTPIYSSDGLLHAVKHRPDKFTESTRYYLHFAGRPIAQLDIPSTGGAGIYLWLTTDHLGTPIMATDVVGIVVWEGGFESFGQDWSGASAAGIDLRFPGQWMDESWQDASEGARGYYNVHRWYEAGVGRYGSVDPIPIFQLGEAGVFSYVGSRPMAEADPLGLEPRKPWVDCDPSGSDVPPPCQCDKPLLRERMVFAQKRREAFCKYRNSSERPPDLPLPTDDSQKEGRVTINGPQIRPSGKACLDWCRCAHERQHLRDVRDPRFAKLDIKRFSNLSECRSFLVTERCLQGFARGGAPTL